VSGSSVLCSDANGEPVACSNLTDGTIPTASSLSVDDLITLSGVAEGSTHLGTFTGTTFTDNQTIKAILQEAETALEAGGGTDDQTLAEVLAEGADGNDIDITSLGKLEGYDAGLYLDWDADGVINLSSDGTLELHSADWDISTTGTITNTLIDGDNNTLQDIAYSSIKSTSRSGSDTTLITGTEGTSGNCAEWDANGDLIGSGAPCDDTPSDITVADESSDTTSFPAFFTAATGDLGPKTDASNLTYNASTGELAAASLSTTQTGSPILLLDDTSGDDFSIDASASGEASFIIGSNEIFNLDTDGLTTDETIVSTSTITAYSVDAGRNYELNPSSPVTIPSTICEKTYIVGVTDTLFNLPADTECESGANSGKGKRFCFISVSTGQITLNPDDSDLMNVTDIGFTSAGVSIVNSASSTGGDTICIIGAQGPADGTDRWYSESYTNATADSWQEGS